MKIVRIEVNPSGSHEFHFASNITSIPEGWAMIPDDMEIPQSFPFVSLEAEKIDHVRDVIVAPDKLERRTLSAMTVTKMNPGIIPPMPEPAPSQLDIIEAQVTYTAMMTDTLLEG